MVDRLYDPTGTRDPEIDEVLGENDKAEFEAMAADLRLTQTTGQKEQHEPAGPLKIDIITTETHVIIEFSKPIRWANLPPDLAIDLGNQLRKWGRKLVKKQYGP